MTKKLKILITILIVILFSNFFYRHVYKPFSVNKIGVKNLDFKVYYFASILIKERDNPYSSSKVRQKIENYFNIKTKPGISKNIATKYLYPIFFARVISPLASLNFSTASKIWIIVNVTFLFIAFLILFKIFDQKNKFINLLIIGIFLNFFHPIQGALSNGQVEIVIFLLFVMFLYYLKEKRYCLASIPVSLAAVIKIYPAIFILFFLIKRYYRTFISAVVLIFLLVVASSITNPLKDSQRLLKLQKFYFFNYVYKINDLHSLTKRKNVSLRGFLMRSFTKHKYSKALVVIDRKLLDIVYVLIGVHLFGLLCLIIKLKRAKQFNTMMMEFFGFLMLVLIFSQYNYSYHLIWTILPLLTLFNTSFPKKKYKSLLFLLLSFIFIGYNNYYVDENFRYLFKQTAIEYIFYSPKIIGQFILFFLILFNLFEVKFFSKGDKTKNYAGSNLSGWHLKKTFATNCQKT
jgi:hypothetical protein